MTREDAIYEIKQLAVLSNEKNIDRITEALEMAIEALQNADLKTESRSEKPNNCKDEQIASKLTDVGNSMVSAVASTMEQLKSKLKDEPQKWTKENCKGCKYNEYPYDSGTCFVRVCINGNKYEPKDEPQIEDLQDWKDRMWAEAVIEPQTDYERGKRDAWKIAQTVFDSTVTLYEAEDVAKRIDKDINVRSKDEAQTIVIVKDHGRKQALEMIDLYHKLKTEPQTDK